MAARACHFEALVALFEARLVLVQKKLGIKEQQRNYPKLLYIGDDSSIRDDTLPMCGQKELGMRPPDKPMRCNTAVSVHKPG